MDKQVNSLSTNLKISTAELCSIIGANPKQVDRWLRRPDLAGRFKSTHHGVRRSMSRENVLQLAFISMLVRCGWSAGDAVVSSQKFLKWEQEKNLKSWLVIRSDQTDGFELFDEIPNAGALELATTSWAPALVILINITSIVERVDRLFSTQIIERKLHADPK